MVSLNNDVYVTGEPSVCKEWKQLNDFERNSLERNEKCCQIFLTKRCFLSDRGLARHEYQHLVDHRDLEVHHKGGEVGYRGTHASASN